MTLARQLDGLPENYLAAARATVDGVMRQAMTPNGLHASPVQNDGVARHVVPPGHGDDPSVSHCWAQVPPVMQTSPDEQVPASRPHFCALVEQANPPTRNATSAIARSRLMGGTLSRLSRARSAPDQAVKRLNWDRRSGGRIIAAWGANR